MPTLSKTTLAVTGDDRIRLYIGKKVKLRGGSSGPFQNVSWVSSNGQRFRIEHDETIYSVNDVVDSM